MARREVVMYRVCDMPHRSETKAVGTETVALNGHRYDMDLCEDHSNALRDAIMRFADHGTKTGEPTIFDKPKAARATTIVARKPPPPAKPEPAPREHMPATAERWRITQHALERMQERGVDIYEVLMAAERPQTSSPSMKDPTAQERVREGVLVVVNPSTLEVLTCVRQDADANRKVG